MLVNIGTYNVYWLHLSYKGRKDKKMVREERERLLITFYNKILKKYSKGNVYFVVHVDVRLKKKKKGIHNLQYTE